jgi:hypothetical protein
MRHPVNVCGSAVGVCGVVVAGVCVVGVWANAEAETVKNAAMAIPVIWDGRMLHLQENSSSRPVPMQAAGQRSGEAAGKTFPRDAD